MSDYTKLKNAELETLLKERSLPHTGKKADLVARLQESDSKKASAETPTTAAASSTTLAPAEDEIDWDDDDTTKATTAPAAAAVAAGGLGEVGDPQKVPNQVADIDPATTEDLTVHPPADNKPSATQASGDVGATAKPAETAEPVKEKTSVDFTSGLANTTLDEEIEKRRARAKKFGIEESTDDALKALERAKKFGGTGEVPKGLNEALPERKERKRGRGGDDGERGGNKRQSQGRSGGRPSGGRDRRPSPRKGRSGGPGWMSEADRAKAEARKAKFATAT